MPSLVVRERRRFGIERFLPGLAERWRSCRERNRTMADLAACDAGEVAHMAADLGISPGELLTLARHDRHATDQLDERLAAVGADAADRQSPVVMRELQRVCTTCSVKARCASDLMRDPDDPVWQEYCANAGTIASLAAGSGVTAPGHMPRARCR